MVWTSSPRALMFLLMLRLEIGYVSAQWDPILTAVRATLMECIQLRSSSDGQPAFLRVLSLWKRPLSLLELIEPDYQKYYIY